MAETAPSWLVATEQGAELSALRAEVAELRDLVAHYQAQAEPAGKWPVEHLGVSALAAHYGVERATVTNWVRRSQHREHPFPVPAVTIRAPQLWVPGWHPRQLQAVNSWRRLRALDRRR